MKWRRAFLWSAVIVLGISACGEGSMSRDKKIAFRFEDFETAEAAKTVLEELHPRGSDLAALLETMKSAGASCVPTNTIVPEYQAGADEYKNGITCSYKLRIWFVIIKDWSVGIRHDGEGKIVEIHTKSYLTGP